MRVVRSPHAHATFELGDLAALRARRPGLVDVLTALDVPNNAFAIFRTCATSRCWRTDGSASAARRWSR
jgi:CO/xanthine dehydrogenase Mo-binding subunit